jgi:hypothetical protein
MSERVAKPVVKNKFWVVEDHGQKVATIQAVDDGTFVYVHDDQREKFSSIKLLSKQYNIIFDKPKKNTIVKPGNQIYGYPTQSKPYNELFDVNRKLPIYTKTAKSRSYFCAGYYLIKMDSAWSPAYCPKLITLNRYQYLGPYTTNEEMLTASRKANGN